MAARLNRKHQEDVRSKIKTTQLMNLLHEESFGERELKDGQRQSIIYLITQAIGKPHQSMAVEHTHTHVSELSDEQLGNIATGSSSGDSAAQSGKKEPSAVH